MSIRNLILLLTPALLLGQPTSNVVSVTASSSSTQQPDQVVFGVTVSSGIDKNLNDIVGALSGSGIVAANLTSVNSVPIVNPLALPPQTAPTVNWNFQLTAPLAKVKDTTTSLTTLQKTIAQANNGLALSFSVTGTQISQSQSCDLGGLVNTGRMQAQKIAAAAGLSVGAIVAVSNFTSNAVPFCSLSITFALGGATGRPGPNSITITATRTSNTPPDQALIAINVTSMPTASLDDITAALNGAGITGATFAGVISSTIYVTNGNQTVPQSVFQWSFSWTAPLAKLRDVLTPLLGAQQTIAKQNLSLSFYIEGARVSAQTQQAQPCSQSDLMSDARAQAEKVALAAGVTAGPILSIADSGSQTALPNYIAGDFLLGVVPSVLYTAPASCSLTAQFQLQ
jgi:uncharacterized protein YggE